MGFVSGQGQQYAPNGSVYFNAPYAPEYYGPSFGNGGNGYTGAPSNAFSRVRLSHLLTPGRICRFPALSVVDFAHACPVETGFPGVKC